MEYSQESDLARVSELLRRTGEFIAYFELAETKMIAWREEIKQQSSDLHQHAQNLQSQLNGINDLLTQAGISRFKVIAEKALSQGENQRQILENHYQQFIQNFQEQQEQLGLVTAQCIDKIEQHSLQASQAIATQLAKYDAYHFHRIANESCEHVERSAKDAINKSKKIFRLFQVRFSLFAMFSTLVTAFIVVVYLNGELPWEMRHKAINERQAGKVLLHAWPNLSLEEKTKILKSEVQQHGG